MFSVVYAWFAWDAYVLAELLVAGVVICAGFVVHIDLSLLLLWRDCGCVVLICYLFRFVCYFGLTGCAGVGLLRLRSWLGVDVYGHCLFISWLFYCLCCFAYVGWLFLS